MSDKLQEIKASVQEKRRLQELKSNLYGTVEVLMMSEIEWLIEQLEQAQQENVECHNEIEQLREENAYLHANVMHLEPVNQKLVECVEAISEHGCIDEELGYERVRNIARQALQEVQHGTSG